MDIEAMKVVFAAGATLATALGVGWTIWCGTSPRKRLKDKFQEAVEFKEKAPRAPIDALIEERGYHLIAGSSDVPAAVVRHLLGMREPSKALRLHRAARSQVVFVGHGPYGRLVYKGWLRSPRFRKWARGVSLAVYIVTYLLATSPLLLRSFGLLSAADAWKLAAITLILFMPPAVISLRYGAKIGHAEVLLGMQERAAKPPSRKRMSRLR